MLSSGCRHGVSDSCGVTFPWGPGKHILYQLDHRGVCLAVEMTAKKPMTRLHCEDRPLPLKHPNSILRETEIETVGGFTARGIYSLVPICRGGITHFFHHSFIYLFHSQFISTLPEGKQNIKPNA